MSGNQDGVEFPEFSEFVARARRDSQARKEAMDAVRVRAAGLSREQIKDLYQAELRARGLEVSPDVILDAHVSVIAGDCHPDVRLLGRALADLARLLGGLGRPPR